MILVQLHDVELFRCHQCNLYVLKNTLNQEIQDKRLNMALLIKIRLSWCCMLDLDQIQIQIQYVMVVLIFRNIPLSVFIVL